MSAAGGRSGVGGGRAGGGSGGGRDCGGGGGHGGDEDERQRLVRSVGAKRRAAKKWTNWSLRSPPSLHPYVPGGAYYRELPPLVHAGEGSSRGAGGGAGRADVRVAEELPFARRDAEERAAVAEAVATSEAELAAELEAEHQEQARAITEVEAFKEREAEARAADVVVIDYADE